MHSHPTNLLAMTYVHPLNAEEFSRTLWQMSTECIVVFPEGTEVLPWMLCGTDEKAEAAIEEGREFVRARPKGIINIDTLSKNFLANDTVTIASLKEKRLIAKSVNHVKVLARGVLDKPLTVKMPDFSIDAIKMIILTGGKAVKIKTVEE